MLKSDLYVDLLYGAQDAFGAARQAAWHNKTSAGAPIEEDQLFWLIETALPRLERNWTPLLSGSGTSMRLSGVFCHKTPLAVYADSKMPSGPKIRRELGDLLLVHDHQGRDARRRAVLMQAKRMDDGRLKADNPEQARLYSDWPRFELRGHGRDGSSFLAGERDFTHSRDGVRYLILDDARHPGHFPYWFDCPWCPIEGDHVNGWLVSDPRGAVGLPGSENFATTFVNMLYEVYPPRGQKAKRYPQGTVPALGKGEDFDTTVHELLTKTFTKELLTKERGRHARKRGEETGFMGNTSGRLPDSSLAFLSGPSASDLDPPGSERAGAGEGDRPIAIVLVETFGD